MFKKLCAFSLLALSCSPFTDPFQTCGTDDASAPRTHATLSDTTSVVLSDQNDPGSLVAPRSTEPGRVTIAPLSGLALTSVVVPHPIVVLRRSVTATVHIRERDSTLPTILRL